MWCCYIALYTVSVTLDSSVSMRDGDLHLHCQPGGFSSLDCWAIPTSQCSHSVKEYWHPWEQVWLQWCCICMAWRLWLFDHPHKYRQPQCCDEHYSGWHDLYPNIHCCCQTEWNSGAVQRINCSWIPISQQQSQCCRCAHNAHVLPSNCFLLPSNQNSVGSSCRSSCKHEYSTWVTNPHVYLL